MDPGSGGFDINGRAITFDVGDPDAEGAEPGPYSTGDVHVDSSKKDISKKTKETLGRYISDKTKGNDFPVDPIPIEKSITTTNGAPVPITSTQNSTTYVDRNEIKYPVSSQQVKLQDPSTMLNFSKGKTDPQNINGNELLKSITTTDLGASKDYTSIVLSNNRFSALSKAVNVDDLAHPGKYNAVLNHPKYGEITEKQLAQVGVALSIRASQELNAATKGNNPSSGAQEARSLLPGFNQLGTERINTRVLEARDVLDSLSKEEIPDANFISSTPGGSWGSMNNVEDPYSGLTSIGMIALATALTAAVVVSFEGVGFVLSLIKGGNASGASKNPDGRYVLGRYTITQGANPNAFPPTSFPPDIGALLGIRPTVHPFSTALQAGVAAFFGIDSSSGLFGQLTSGLTQTLEHPAFNAIHARNIIRSSLFIIDSFKRAFASSNLISGIENVLKIVETLRSSKLIAAFNVFASLGDQVLIEEEKGETIKESDGALPEEPRKVSRIDKLDDSAGAVSKNRLRDPRTGKFSLKLAWASNRAPASYLIPDSLLTLSALGGRLGSFNSGIGLQDPSSRTFFRIMKLAELNINGSRLPLDGNDDEVTVKNMERLLEAEYMPFYMHDLRTNEIISFHAFITQLTDDYSANWERSEGYGRMDPIKIYKNTERKIGIGFNIVATSEEDFNDMWLKINKLVTLVYPQYTKGKLLVDESGNNQFIQPFSQLIGASPLVRIRLGNLFRSNYSRFALARLFGADSNVMKLDSRDIKFEDGQTSIETLQNSLKRDLESPVGKQFTLGTTNLPKASESSISIGLSSPIGGGGTGDKPSNAPSFNVALGDLAYFLFKVSSENSDGSVNVVPELLRVVDLQEFYGMSSSGASDKIAYLKNEYANSSKGVKNVVGGTYVAAKDQLRPALRNVKTAFEKSFGTGIDNMESLASFLLPDNNALVKSFQSTEGKGLAGTIDTINFNWYDQVLWDVSPGKRAPQMCKVTISFSPIHDIPPGLSHNGFNRGPVYPVGHYLPSADDIKKGS